MNGVYQWLVALHQQNPHLIKALLAGTMVSTVCGVVGCFIVLRRTSFLADALAHSMLAGVVCGYLFMKLVFSVPASAPAMLLGSLLAGFITVGMVGFVSKFSRVKEDAVIGVMYTGIFAFGGVLLSFFSQHVHVDLVHFLTGDVLAVRDADLWMMAGVTAGVLAVIILCFRPLQLISFDTVMAASIGIPVLALDYLLTICTSLVVVSGVNIVGVILVVGLLITPASTAYMLCDRLSRMLVVSALFGFLSFAIGYAFSEKLNVAPGSAVVLVSALQFMLIFFVAPRYGFLADWMRRRRSVPQQLIEDVLGCVLRAPGLAVGMETIYQHVAGGTDRIQRAIRSLERREWLQVEGRTVKLTDDGRREAKRVLRSHRLWESYLAHVGTPEEELHHQAHRLEHLHDEATVDYLDDKLGHPTKDPHGAAIPEDFVHLTPGATVKAALLRQGHQGVVVSVGPLASKTPLRAGMTVTSCPRQGDDDVWVFTTDTSEQVQLDHKTADDVVVRLSGNGD